MAKWKDKTQNIKTLIAEPFVIGGGGGFAFSIYLMWFFFYICVSLLYSRNLLLSKRETKRIKCVDWNLFISISLSMNFNCIIYWCYRCFNLRTQQIKNRSPSTHIVHTNIHMLSKNIISNSCVWFIERYRPKCQLISIEINQMVPVYFYHLLAHWLN